MRLRELRVLAVWCVLLSSAEASDRLKVIIPPKGQDYAERLLDSFALACNSGDFVGVMSHFTPAYGKKVRGRMEDIFIKSEPRIDVRKVTLLSESEEKITFGVRYMWRHSEEPETIFASKVTARRIAGQWKLDGEVVQAIDRTGSASQYGESADRKVGPVAWDAFNPPAARISPALEHLRGDVGIQPGLGCVNGQCRR